MPFLRTTSSEHGGDGVFVGGPHVTLLACEEKVGPTRPVLWLYEGSKMGPRRCFPLLGQRVRSFLTRAFACK